MHNISYNTVQGVTVPYPTTIEAVAEAIKIGSFESHIGPINLKQPKAGLPVFCSAFWLPGCESIKENDIHSFSGLMVFDIDQYEDQELNERYKSIIMQKYKKHLLMMFRSPSGGVKFILKTNLDTPDKALYKFTYKKLIKQIKSFGITEGLDENTCNIGRVTRMPYDSEIYFNPNAESFRCKAKMLEKYQEHVEALNKRQAINAAHVGEIDREKAEAHMQNILAGLDGYIAGSSRHRALSYVAWHCFNSGLDKWDLGNYYSTMESLGQLDKDINTSQKRLDVIEANYNDWMNAGGEVNKKFKKANYAQQKQTAKNLLALALQQA